MGSRAGGWLNFISKMAREPNPKKTSLIFISQGNPLSKYGDQWHF